MDYIKFCVDFVEDRIDYSQFVHEVLNDVEFEKWIDELGKDQKSHIFDKKNFTLIDIPFSIRHYLSGDEAGEGDVGSLGFQLNFYTKVQYLINSNFPEVEMTPTTRYEDMFKLYLDACPEYIDGPEVWESKIIDNLIETCPEDWTKGKKVKFIKSRIKELFYLDGRHYPHWWQTPHWPFTDGKPMKYVKTVTKKKGEWYQHYFVNPETGEERIIDDID